MITIKVKQKPPIKDDDFFSDNNYKLDCKIKIPEDATLNEALSAFFEALLVAGYSPENIEEIERKIWED